MSARVVEETPGGTADSSADFPRPDIRRSIRRVIGRGIGRVAGMLLVVWGAATLGFVALRLVPGDPVDVMIGAQADVSEAVRQQIREEWGLADPVAVQYLRYLGRLVRGDLGTSYRAQQPVADLVGQQLLPTVQLMAAAVLVALILALSSALLGRGRWAGPMRLLELVAVSSPAFWIGLVLISVFAFGLGWFPVSATDGLAALVLPAFTLAIPVGGIISQVLRQGLDDAAALPFVDTVRARGVGRARLVLHHTLRHAAADSVTLTGYIIGSLLGGSVLVESVFARPGLGQVALNAIVGRDFPVVLGIIVLAAVTFAIVNLLVDVAAEVIDPRVRVNRVYA